MTTSKKIREYLKVEKHKVFAKTNVTIKIELEEYKNLGENYGEEVGIAEIDNVLEIPGFFTMEFTQEGDSIDFFFPYSIYLNKGTVIQENKDIIELQFQPEEMIFYSAIKNNETDIRVLKSLFENGVKYLGNKPDKLLTAIWLQVLKNTNIPWWHLEVLVSQLYGGYDKKTKEMVPLRLLNVPYNKKYILNLKESSHKLNQTMPFLYGYSKDAIREMVSKKKRGENSFFENILSGDYDKLTKSSTLS